jgi:spermidine/putrescine-binding protein
MPNNNKPRDFFGGPRTRRDINRVLAALGATTVALPILGGPALAQFDNTPSDPDLWVFTWAGYEYDRFMPQYVEKYGMVPTFSFFAEEEEAFQKLRNDFTPDAAHPCTASVGRWRDAGLLKPIDTSRLIHWDDYFPTLKTIKGVEYGGETFLMPWDWGNSSILYREDLVEIDGEESYSLLLDERYAGRMAMYDSVDAMTAAAGLIAGVANPFDMNDEEMAATREVMRQIHKNMLFYWTDQSSVEQAIASGELVASWAWNDAAENLKRQGLPVRFMNPKEGVMTWLCGVVRLAEGEGSEDKLYEFLNAMSSPQSGAALIETYSYGHANRKSFELADQQVIAELGFTDVDSFMATGNFYDEIAPDQREKLITMFDEVKAGL